MPGIFAATFNPGTQTRGAEIAYYDPHIPVVCPIRKHPRFEGMRSVNWDAETLRGFSVVVICTAHDGVDYDLLLQHGHLIVDTRNALPTRKVKVWKA